MTDYVKLPEKYLEAIRRKIWDPCQVRIRDLAASKEMARPSEFELHFHTRDLMHFFAAMDVTDFGDWPDVTPVANVQGVTIYSGYIRPSGEPNREGKVTMLWRGNPVGTFKMPREPIENASVAQRLKFWR